MWFSDKNKKRTTKLVAKKNIKTQPALVAYFRVMLLGACGTHGCVCWRNESAASEFLFQFQSPSASSGKEMWRLKLIRLRSESFQIQRIFDRKIPIICTEY